MCVAGFDVLPGTLRFIEAAAAARCETGATALTYFTRLILRFYDFIVIRAAGQVRSGRGSQCENERQSGRKTKRSFFVLSPAFYDASVLRH